MVEGEDVLERKRSETGEEGVVSLIRGGTGTG